MALLLLLLAILAIFAGSGTSSTAVTPPRQATAPPANCVTVTWWRTAPGEKKPCLVPGKPLKVRIYSDPSP
jgi:hypothetical protein